jgi:hypothetical protein
VPIGVAANSTDADLWSAAVLSALTTGADHRRLYLSLLQQRLQLTIKEERQCPTLASTDH